ncbi:hypothetical protein AB0758_30840 [Tolypothrix bouteillei VB521301_2]|uniref:hypothetical protein n=1 Tax=Tolypothrix bouteillei TaxID=1246981 RepID=UPI0038B57348
MAAERERRLLGVDYGDSVARFDRCFEVRRRRNKAGLTMFCKAVRKNDRGRNNCIHLSLRIDDIFLKAATMVRRCLVDR